LARHGKKHRPKKSHEHNLGSSSFSPLNPYKTSNPFPSKNNKRDAMVANADGSVDLYFGPTAPAGKEKNWIQTVPSKGWYTILRRYGPLESWFDKTWRPGEIEEVK
jgi:hypothetical protein